MAAHRGATDDATDSATGAPQAPGRIMRRRGLMAGAAALVAALAAHEGITAPPVAATDGMPLIVGASNTTASQTGLSGSNVFGPMVTITNNATSGTGAIYGFAHGNGAGVQGDGVNGPGVYGTYGSATVGTQLVAGVAGLGPVGGIGVIGQALGMSGFGVNGTGGTYGVRGSSSSGAGVGGTSISGAGVSGVSETGIGVMGLNANSGAAPFGVVGMVSQAPGFALFGVATVSGTVGFAGAASVPGAIAGQFAGNVNFFGGNGAVGNTVTLNGANLVVANGGTKNAAVRVSDGSVRLLHCVEAPEPWFEDFGEATLAGGKAEVKLDPLFASTIDTGTLHVFCMPHDESHHLAVRARSGSGFTVAADPSGPATMRGVKASDLNGSFTYRVVGKRKDVSGERLAHFDLPKEIKLTPPPVPALPTDEPKKSPMAKGA